MFVTVTYNSPQGITLYTDIIGLFAVMAYPRDDKPKCGFFVSFAINSHEIWYAETGI